VKTTESGKLLLPHATLIVREERDALNAMFELRDGFSGTIRIGSGATWMGRLLPRAVAQFHKSRPNVRFQIVAGYKERLIELPVVILTLVKIEILDYAALKRFRQYAIVGNLILAAFATPSGDPITMFLMAIPLQILYEVSTLVAWYWERRDRKRLEKGAG
jgi:hypothetical protein